MMTTKKVDTGVFEVLWNGKKTSYEIINGSRGLSGKDTRNMYGIVLPNGRGVKWIGALNDAKGILAQWFKAKAPKTQGE